MNRQIQVKHILIALAIIVLGFILFSGYSSNKYLEKENKKLSETNEVLQSNIDSLIAYNVMLEEKLTKSTLQVSVYEKDVIKTLGKLSQIKTDYQNEKKNPIFSTTVERVNFIRSEIGK
jgi:hypothetical protein